jgi:DNA processing protein
MEMINKEKYEAAPVTTITDKAAGVSKAEWELDMAYRYWLYSIEGIGRKSLMVLEAFAGSPSEIYRLPERELKWLLTNKQMAALMASRTHWEVEGEYRRLRERGIGFYPCGHPDYPARFHGLPDPPAALYVKGRLPDPARYTVALIGTRSCSGYGSGMARELGTALAAAGIQVVSGMARGIDGIAQRAAVVAGGCSFAVLGCGVDVCYPAENKRLYDRLTESGGILSEYVPGTQPKAQLFPPRNRIISGLSDVVVVVEAREKSGTMITVDMALEQGREVYAVPGRVADGASSGCNRLIKQGAGMILSVEEFLEELGMGSGVVTGGSRGGMRAATGMRAEAAVATAVTMGVETEIAEKETKEKETKEKETMGVVMEKESRATAGMTIELAAAGQVGGQTAGLTAEEKLVWGCLKDEPRSLDDVAGVCAELPMMRVMQILVALCVKGRAVQMGGGYYCRREG